MTSSSKVVPAILTDDPESLEVMIHQAESFTGYVQVDIMDGQFVPSRSITAKHLRDISINLEWEAHLMVNAPENYFEDFEHFRQVRQVFGTEQLYEYEKERTFVNTVDKEKVFDELLGDFKRDSIPYLGRQNFPLRFAQSKYTEIQKHYYRYRHLLEKE